MSFSFAENTYTDVLSLTNELTSRYEGANEGEITQHSLTITANVTPDRQTLQALITFITHPSRKCIYRINLLCTPIDTEINQALQLAATLAEIQQTALQIRRKKSDKKINPAKVDLKFKKRVPVPVQILHLIPDTLVPARTPKDAALLRSAPSHVFTKEEMPLALPTFDQFSLFYPFLNTDLFTPMVETDFPSAEQFSGFLKAMDSPYHKEILFALMQLKTPQLHGLVAKLLLIGGDLPVLLCLNLLKELKEKHVNLDFLTQSGTSPTSINPLLSAQGLKTLHKLSVLKPDQLEWWNALVLQHLQFSSSFEFLPSFNAYSQFLVDISELGLNKLPTPCPISNPGDMQASLKAIYTIFKNAKEKGEATLHAQSNDLAGLNWQSAMRAVTEGRFGYVHQKMCLDEPDALAAHLKDFVTKDDPTPFAEKWLLRIFAKYWKNGVSLPQITHVKTTIEALPLDKYSALTRKYLLFIITSTFTAPGELSDVLWQKQIDDFTEALHTVPIAFQEPLLRYLTACSNFKPHPPSLPQLQFILQTLVELLPNRIEELPSVIDPILECYLNEGPDILPSILARIDKLESAPGQSETAVVASSVHFNEGKKQAILALAEKLKGLRAELLKFMEPEDEAQFCRLLACLPDTGSRHTPLELAQRLKPYPTLIKALASINISKSTALPSIDSLFTFLESTACKTLVNTGAQDVPTLIQRLNDGGFLAGALFGEAQLSQLNDLIVEAIVAFFKREIPLSTYLSGEYEPHFHKNSQVPKSLQEAVHPGFLKAMTKLEELEKLANLGTVDFDALLARIDSLDSAIRELFEKDYPVKFGRSYPGRALFEAVTTGKCKNYTTLDWIVGPIAHPQIIAALEKPVIEAQAKAKETPTKSTLDAVAEAKYNAARNTKWLADFNITPSVIILFEDELLKKRVLPQVTSTLDKLEVVNPLRTVILKSVEDYDRQKPTKEALIEYNSRLHAARELLNILRILKNELSPTQFAEINSLLSLAGLELLSLTQQSTLLNTLFNADPAQIIPRLRDINHLIQRTQLASTGLELDRTIKALPALFNLENISAEEKNRFLNVSFAHNLKSAEPFPFKPIIMLRNLEGLTLETKNQLLKQFINLLQAKNIDLSLLTSVIETTRNVLMTNPQQTTLVLSLLKRFNLGQLNSELSTYIVLLTCNQKEESSTPATPAVSTASIELTPEQTSQIVEIITCLSKTDDTDVSLDTLKRIMNMLSEAPTKLNYVYRLFLTVPYPNASMLEEALALSFSELSNYCNKFDLNPFAKPGEERPLDMHFSMASAKTVIQGLKDLKLEHGLSHQVLIELAQRLNHINEIGFNECKHLSRDKLKTTTKALLEKFRTKSSGFTADSLEFEYHQHLLLAHIRELYYRTTCTTDSQGNKTGLFPHSTQMLTLLLSLSPTKKLFPDGRATFDLPNLLMGIQTGQGKSIITPLLGALLWGQDEGTVDICTANTDLLVRDYNENYKPLFDALEIHSSMIRANSAADTYIEGGINCSTLKEMGLFRMSAAHHKTPINENSHKTHLLLDEVDTILDKSPLLGLGKQPSQEGNTDALAWLYPLIYDFIHLENFQHVGTKAWSEEEDIAELIKHVSLALKDDRAKAQKMQQLMTLPNIDLTLRQFITAACRVELLEIEQDFILQSEEVGDGVVSRSKLHVVPTSESIGIFPDGWQPALLARLQRENPRLDITIPPTASILAYQSIQRLIQSYKATGGRMLGISGTLGTPAELRYLATEYSFEALDIPTHEKNHRTEHQPCYSSSREENAASIIKTIARIRKPYTQPVVMYNSADTKKNADRRFAQAQAPSLLVSTKDVKEARYYTEEIQKWAQTHIDPICFIIDDMDKDKFQARCLSEQQALNMSPSQAETIKMVLASKLTPALSKKLLKQGYSFQPVTGKETSAEIQARLKQSFYQVQFIDGTETALQLKQKITKAAQPNMITVGPNLKLGRGVDVKNENNHHYGVTILPTSLEENKRMVRQIAGRVGRNGDPGHIYPHYQISPPTIWWQKFCYLIFPIYKQAFLRKQINVIQARLAEEEAVERMYSTRIDDIQQSLLSLFDTWSRLFLDNEAPSPRLEATLLEMRSDLLNEVRNAQSSFVTTLDIEEKITAFENNLNELWDSYKTEKLIPLIGTIKHLTPAQEVGFPYLSTLSLKHERQVQSAKHRPPHDELARISKPSREQTLDLALANKAGCVLSYATELSPDKVASLQKEEFKQVLPHLIYEFETQCPQASMALNSILKGKVANVNSSLKAIVNQVGGLFTRLSTLVLRGINYLQNLSGLKQISPEKKAQEKTQRIIAITSQLEPWTEEKLNELLALIENTLITQTNTNKPLVEQFKLQNLILTFAKLKASGLPKPVARREGLLHQPAVNTSRFQVVEQKFTKQLMKQLALIVSDKLAWAKHEPQSYLKRPLHVSFEREVVIKAASETYQAAQDFLKQINGADDNEKANQAFYAVLQKQAHLLRPLTILSLGHSNPRQVILDSLDIIDNLTHAPLGCDNAFRREAHDKAIIQIHLEAFNRLVKTKGQKFAHSRRWNSFVKRLTALSQATGVEVGTLYNLQACILRFLKDARFQDELSVPLKELEAQLSCSIETLTKPQVLIVHPESLSPSFLKKQAITLSHALSIRLNYDETKRAALEKRLEIRTGFDGLHEFVEMKLPTLEGLELGPQAIHYTPTSRTKTLLAKNKEAITHTLRLLNVKQETFVKEPLPADTSFIPPELQSSVDHIRELESLQHLPLSAWLNTLSKDAALTELRNLTTNLLHFSHINWENEEIPNNPLLTPSLVEALKQRATYRAVITRYDEMISQTNQNPATKVFSWVKTTLGTPTTQDITLENYNESQARLSIINTSLKTNAAELCDEHTAKIRTMLNEHIYKRKETLINQAKTLLTKKIAHIDSYENQEKCKASTTSLRFYSTNDFCDFVSQFDEEKSTVQDDPRTPVGVGFFDRLWRKSKTHLNTGDLTLSQQRSFMR